MESIKASGKAWSIGVSNYSVTHLKETLETAKIPPSINQIEHHPYMQNEDLLEFSRENGIATSVYGALAPLTRNRAGSLDETLAKLSQKYNVSPGMICLAWCLQAGLVVVTTSSKEERMAEYLKACDLKLADEDMAAISMDGKESVKGLDILPRVQAYYQSLKK